jgi:hypothetical protein
VEIIIGTLRRTSRKPSEITELPIGTWTEDYKTFLETEVSKAKFSRGRLTLHRGRRTIRSPRYSTRCRSSYDIRRFETYDRAEKSEDD